MKVSTEQSIVHTRFHSCGSRYFGSLFWEEMAPGLCIINSRLGDNDNDNDNNNGINDDDNDLYYYYNFGKHQG